MLEDLKLSSFSEYLNTGISVHIGQDEITEFEIIQARDSGSTARQERFSILFRGPLDVALEQGIYKVEHSNLGSFDLFIVPVGISQSGREYEAVFNRLLR